MAAELDLDDVAAQSQNWRSRQVTAKLTTLHRGERIIAAVPERCQGPGWSNSVVWVYIASQDGRLRTECLQPSDQTHEMHALFDVGAAMCRALVDAVSQEMEAT